MEGKNKTAGWYTEKWAGHREGQRRHQREAVEGMREAERQRAVGP